MNNCLYNLIIILFLLAIFNKTNGKETFAETAAVRCCKGDSDKKIEMDEKSGGYGCHENKTFKEAKELCKGAGFNLCRGSKLIKQKNTGCYFNKKQIWIQGGKTCRGNNAKCKDVVAQPVQQQTSSTTTSSTTTRTSSTKQVQVQQQPDPVQQQPDPVQQPQQSGSLCKSIKISNPACPDKGYRGWNF